MFLLCASQGLIIEFDTVHVLDAFTGSVNYCIFFSNWNFELHTRLGNQVFFNDFNVIAADMLSEVTLI